MIQAITKATRIAGFHGPASMRPMLALCALLGLTACISVPISYYDATTYTQLTSLKVDATMLVETFDTKPLAANEAKIEAVTIDLKKAYEYEKGKGEPNSDTAQQFDKIVGLFLEDVEDYRKGRGPELGEKYFQ